jgi:hypothetical protein
MSMKKMIFALALATAALSASPASAAVLIDQGVTYQLNLTGVSADGKTGNFALVISGINGASDTEGGRTGINGIAFTDPSLGNAVGGVLAGFTFQTGGLDSGGCNGSGNFFCFSNTSFDPGSPLPAILSLVFTVTSDTAGSWLAWDPSFKIDWLGSQNNYDLVSKGIPLNVCIHADCPTPTPQGAVPEPATWAMMLLGFAGIGAAMRRRRRAPKLLQIA